MSAELPDPGFAPGSIFRLLELRIRVQTALRAGDQAGADKWQAALEAEFPAATKSTDPPDPGPGKGRPPSLAAKGAQGAGHTLRAKRKSWQVAARGKGKR